MSSMIAIPLLEVDVSLKETLIRSHRNRQTLTWKVSIVIVYELRSWSPKYMRPKVKINPSGDDSFIS